MQPGGTIVEATAGNTGLGLALVARAKEYRVVLVVPDKMSSEKVLHLKALGAEVHTTRFHVVRGHPDYYQDVAARLAKEIPGAFFVNQFHNPDNSAAHRWSTGPELWAQSGQRDRRDRLRRRRGRHAPRHSTTKYLNGRSDIIGGVAIVAGDERNAQNAERLGFLQNAVGAIAGPFDSFLALRGVKTLDVRMQRHCENITNMIVKGAIAWVFGGRAVGLPVLQGYSVGRVAGAVAFAL